MTLLTMAEEPTASTAVAIAGTLLGAVSFNLILFYLTNHSDDDMRRYTYDVINGTVSIFSSVLIFTTFNDLVETYILGKKGEEVACSREFESLVDFIHMMIWFALLQLALALISGALGRKPKKQADAELNMKSIATLLAHLTGFASINAWGSLQQLDVFRSNAAMSFVVVPISCFGQVCLQRLTHNMRKWVMRADDGQIDKYEWMWDEETQEAENDVMGLALSFNLTQASRFALRGVLPNQEGQVPDNVLAATTGADVLKMYGVGFLFVVLMVVIFYKKPGEEEEEEADPKRESLLKLEEGEKVEELEEDIYERMLDAMILTFSMGFAWCVFFGTRSYLASFPALAEPMLRAVTLTMVISFCSISVIRLLDILADLDCTGEKVDNAIKQTIKAISILVGFSWEQAFDAAVDVLGDSTSNPHLAKVILALFCVLIIVPAWKWYLVPMALRDGWKFGYVVEDPNDEDGRKLLEEKLRSLLEHLEAKNDKDIGILREPGSRKGDPANIHGVVFLNNQSHDPPKTVELTADSRKCYRLMSTEQRDEFERLQKEVQELRTEKERLQTDLAVHRPLDLSVSPVSPNGKANGKPLTGKVNEQLDRLEELTQSLVGAFERSKTSPT